MKFHKLLITIFILSLASGLCLADTLDYSTGCWADTSTGTYIVTPDTTPYIPPPYIPPALPVWTPPVWTPPEWSEKELNWISQGKIKVAFEHIYDSPVEQRFGVAVRNLKDDTTEYADLRLIIDGLNFNAESSEIEIYSLPVADTKTKWQKVDTISESADKDKRIKYIGCWQYPPANNSKYKKYRFYEVRIKTPNRFEKDVGWGTSGILKLKLGDVEYKDTEHSSWWSSSWPYRQKITIDNSASIETLSNFPVLVHISTANCGTNFDFSSDSNTVRFVDQDDSTACDFETEYWSLSTSTGVADIHVEIPQIQSQAATDYFYQYYGASGVDNASDPSAVWDNNFVMVQHLQEDPSGDAPQMIDSTQYDNDGTSYGTMTSGDQVVGQVDGSLDFDGSDDGINCGNNASLNITDAITIEVWIFLRSKNTGDFQTIAGRGYDDQTISLQNWMQFPPNDGSPTMCCKDASGEHWVGAADAEINLNTWYYLAGTKDTTIMKLWVNAIQRPDTYLSGTSSNSTAQFTIGRWTKDNDKNPLYGIIDEVRVSDIVRSSEWIEASYLSQTDNYITFGAEEEGEAPPAVTPRRPNYIIQPMPL